MTAGIDLKKGWKSPALPFGGKTLCTVPHRRHPGIAHPVLFVPKRKVKLWARNSRPICQGVFLPAVEPQGTGTCGEQNASRSADASREYRCHGYCVAVGSLQTLAVKNT